MKNPRLLIIEDDESIRELLSLTLEADGYQEIFTAADGAEGMAMLRKCHPDLVLLDLMLPGVDGLTICQMAKSSPETRHSPSIMLTAKSTEADIVRGLDLGASDYVTKPFNRKVLLARIRTQLRTREEQGEQDVYLYGPLKLDCRQHLATLEGSPLELTAGEFTLLHLFLTHPGRVFTRTQIVTHTKGTRYPVTERSIDVQMVSLRRKLGEWGRNIETVRGVGYRLKSQETP